MKEKKKRQIPLKTRTLFSEKLPLLKGRIEEEEEADEILLAADCIDEQRDRDRAEGIIRILEP